MDIVLPSKPKIIKEEDDKGVYEIDGLYPGYGHTLGNSLRRILLSSLPGAAITTAKIEGVEHEFSAIDGIKEDVINILLNLKNIRFKMHDDGIQTITLKIKGAKKVTAKDLILPSQVEVVNKDVHIATLTNKDSKLNIELTVEVGLGYVPKEVSVTDKVEVGTMVLDAVFTPIRRISYDVENMRVGGRTDFNRLRISIQTDGSIAPREALEESITIMIKQLKAIVGFKEEEEIVPELPTEAPAQEIDESEQEDLTDTSKIKVDDLSLSSRTLSALQTASIRTIGGLAKKSTEDLLALEGLGEKALQEIKRALGNLGITLKE